jgi:hypothetical protein
MARWTAGREHSVVREYYTRLHTHLLASKRRERLHNSPRFQDHRGFNGFDRLLLRGNLLLLRLNFAAGIEAFLHYQGALQKDFELFARQVTQPRPAAGVTRIPNLLTYPHRNVSAFRVARERRAAAVADRVVVDG